jgi:hypothetical protein
MYGSYVYRGKSIPKMSGYQTAILVHKEGIMNNEEIYKYAEISLKKWQNKFDLQWIAISGIFLFGIMTFMLPATMEIGWSWVYIELSAVVMVLCYALILTKLVSKHDLIRRDYIYNLVRADERKRCMTKMERYEHEGSK